MSLVHYVNDYIINFSQICVYFVNFLVKGIVIMKTKVKNESFSDYTEKVMLTNGAIGLFLSMTNVPEWDYKTFDEILKFNNVDSSEDVQLILNELIDTGFLIHPNNNPKIYAVNKLKLINFELFSDTKRG